MAINAWAQVQHDSALGPLLVQAWRQPPWLDPEEAITEDRMAETSQQLGISLEKIRSQYEALAKDLDLKLSWKDKQSPASV
jgi:hypothetical protein